MGLILVLVLITPAGASRPRYESRVLCHRRAGGRKVGRLGGDHGLLPQLHCWQLRVFIEHERDEVGAIGGLRLDDYPNGHPLLVDQEVPARLNLAGRIGLMEFLVVHGFSWVQSSVCVKHCSSWPARPG